MQNIKHLIAAIEAGRARQGLSETELARLAGVTQPTAHRILSGQSKSPRLENLQALAKAAGITTDLFLGEDVVAESSTTYSVELENTQRGLGKIPVISWVQAGSWCEAIEPQVAAAAEEWLDCPFPHSSKAFGLVIKGLSMYPDYRQGEVILVEPELEAAHNDDVVARTPDGDATFKRLQHAEDGTYLLALNPEWPSRLIKIPSGTVICGVVTGSWISRRKR